MKENEEFEEWYEKEPVDYAMSVARYTYESHKEWSRKAYMMQQQKIDALNVKLEKAKLSMMAVINIDTKYIDGAGDEPPVNYGTWYHDSVEELEQCLKELGE